MTQVLPEKSRIVVSHKCGACGKVSELTVGPDSKVECECGDKRAVTVSTGERLSSGFESPIGGVFF